MRERIMRIRRRAVNPKSNRRGGMQFYDFYIKYN